MSRLAAYVAIFATMSDEQLGHLADEDGDYGQGNGLRRAHHDYYEGAGDQYESARARHQKGILGPFLDEMANAAKVELGDRERTAELEKARRCKGCEGCR